MMKAVIAQDKQTIIVELPIPQPQEGELLVRVATTALNRADLLQVAGNYPPPSGSPDTLGLEFAGTVEAIGAGVTRFAVGDRVMALVGGGGYATYALVHEAHAMPIPDNLTLIEAGAVVEAYLTAYSNMVELGELQQGETVLIHAGASGVGLAACQIARAIGATTLVTASASKHAVCLEHGASLCMDYRTEDFVERVLSHSPDGVQLVVDMVGAPYWNKNVSVLQEWGRIVFIGLQGGATTEVNFGQIMAKRLTVRGSTLRNRTHERKAGLIARFSAWGLPRLASGELKPNVWKVMPMSAVAEAHDLMRNNQNTGKIILLVDE